MYKVLICYPICLIGCVLKYLITVVIHRAIITKYLFVMLYV